MNHQREAPVGIEPTMRRLGTADAERDLHVAAALSGEAGDAPAAENREVPTRNCNQSATTLSSLNDGPAREDASLERGAGELTPEHLQVLAVAVGLYREKMRHWGFDRKPWGRARLRIAAELLEDLNARLGLPSTAIADALPPFGVRFAPTARGRAALRAGDDAGSAA